MSKRCPDCGALNEDSRIYCSSCGELLDPELRLIKNLDAQTSGPKKPAQKEPQPKPEPVRPQNPYEEEYNPSKLSRQKKRSAALWIILGLIALGIVVWLVLSYAV